MAHVLPGSWIPFRSFRGMDKEEMTGGEGGTTDRLGDERPEVGTVKLEDPRQSQLQV